MKLKKTKKKWYILTSFIHQIKKSWQDFLKLLSLKYLKKKNRNKKVTTMNKKLASDISLI